MENTSASRLRGFYRFAAFAASIGVLGTIADIVIGSLLGGDLTALPHTAAERFEQLEANVWLGLYNLDLLNVVIQLLTMPVYAALYYAHRRRAGPLAVLAAGVFLVGTAVFVSNNAALPMLALSGKYDEAGDDLRTLYASAGESLLARGAHGSPGVFFGFSLAALAGLTMSLALLKASIFSKAVAWFGFAGNALLLIYVVLVTFVPGVESFAMFVAMPGGILALLWTIFLAFGLFRLAGADDKKR